MIYLRPRCAKNHIQHHGEQRGIRGRISSQRNSQSKDEGRCDTNKGIWKGDEGHWWVDGEVVILG